MTKNFVAYWLVIDYSLIIGNNQWLINWLPIDYLLITHWFHWCHWLVMSGLLQCLVCWLLSYGLSVLAYPTRLWCCLFLLPFGVHAHTISLLRLYLVLSRCSSVGMRRLYYYYYYYYYYYLINQPLLRNKTEF